MSEQPRVVFYWRPGCGFCRSLERELAKRNIAIEMHNIWEDAGAAATVRSIANGNETVPTVVVGTSRMVNPSADAVERAIAQAASAR